MQFVILKVYLKKLRFFIDHLHVASLIKLLRAKKRKKEKLHNNTDRNDP